MLKKQSICLKITMISIEIVTEVAQEEIDQGMEETTIVVINLHLDKIKIIRIIIVILIEIIDKKKISQVPIVMAAVDRVMLERNIVITGQVTTILT